MWDKGGNQVIWGYGWSLKPRKEFCSLLLFCACMSAACLCMHRRSLAVLLRTAFPVSRRGLSFEGATCALLKWGGFPVLMVQ